MSGAPSTLSLQLAISARASMMLIAILTVRKGAEAAFRAFERHAAAVMKMHGGESKEQ